MLKGSRGYCTAEPESGKTRPADASIRCVLAAARQAVEVVGLPECQLNLAQAVTYLPYPAAGLIEVARANLGRVDFSLFGPLGQALPRSVRLSAS